MLARLYHRGGAVGRPDQSLLPTGADSLRSLPSGSSAESWVDIGDGTRDIPASWLREAVSLWQKAGDRYLEQHPDFMRANDRIEGSHTRFFERRDASGLRAYAAVEAGFTEFAWQLGATTLLRRRLRRLRIVRGPVFAPDIDDTEAATATAALLLLLHSRFRGWPVFLESSRPALAGGAPLADAKLRSAFLISRRRPPQARYALDLPESVDEFLQGLEAKHRQDIRRHTRRLNQACDGDVELVAFREPEEVDTFLATALPLARKTYQYRLYAAGLAADPHLAALGRLLAERGWWRGHLLKARGTPVAFSLGYQIDGTYFGLEMGYDPAWAHLGVGGHIVFRLIESMLTGTGRPTRLDFGHGASDYKRRIATLTRQEEFYDFIPWRSATIVPHLSFRAWTTTTRTLLKTLKRHGIRTRRQRFRDAQAGNAGEAPDAGDDGR